MKHRTILLSGLGFALGIAVILALWKPIVEIAFTFGLGQEPACDLGDGYELITTVRTIVYWPSSNREQNPFEVVIDQSVEEFSLIDRWIVGRTEHGWFAINKDSHKVHRSKQVDEIESLTHIDLDTVKMETDPWPYLIVKPQALAAKRTATDFCWVLLFVVPVFFASIPILVTRLSKKSDPS